MVINLRRPVLSDPRPHVEGLPVETGVDFGKFVLCPCLFAVTQCPISLLFINLLPFTEQANQNLKLYSSLLGGGEAVYFLTCIFSWI